jgi:heptosyltransferase-3
VDATLPKSVRLASIRRVAFVMSNAIGDSLVSMVIVQNLRASGIDVCVFGTPIYALRHWFPHVEIHPLPREADCAARLEPFDAVVQMHRHQPFAHLAGAHPHVIDLHDIEYADAHGCMAERFVQFCRTRFGIVTGTTENGITAPATLKHRRYRHRVVIHPEASTDDKRWSRARFIALARRLQALGYEVCFVIAPSERARWTELETLGIAAPAFDDLHALACWVYESGWFIGNDSGIGHLASNVSVPTISLFRRRAVAERWRPAWGTVRVVLPWQWLPTSRLKEKFWREALTCRRVVAVFRQLAEQG